MPDSELKPDILPQRLCSEIQLFDLCDLDSCKSKIDRFCTNPDLITRFEKVAVSEFRTPERFVEDEEDSEFEDEDSFSLDDSDYEDDGLDEDL
jgi:hypothetical protein